MVIPNWYFASILEILFTVFNSKFGFVGFWFFIPSMGTIILGDLVFSLRWIHFSPLVLYFTFILSLLLCFLLCFSSFIIQFFSLLPFGFVLSPLPLVRSTHSSFIFTLIPLYYSTSLVQKVFNQVPFWKPLAWSPNPPPPSLFYSF